MTRQADDPRNPGSIHPPAEQGTDDGAPTVSIVIKALNEEANIARAVESALDALDGLSGEVIVADSLSRDRTVDIAAAYPVTVVQLRRACDRCCGAGPQLGYQYALGRYLYILDGDMELVPSFIAKAVRFLDQHREVAGVAGLVEELGDGSYEFRARRSARVSWCVPGLQRWLDMGGLYRRSALQRIGHFSNRNLHACEEQELGLRLGGDGHLLVRLPLPSVRHHGRREGSWTLMKRRLASRYSDGPGELLRALLGTPMAWPALRSHINLALMAGLWGLNIAGLIALAWTPLPLLAGAVLSALTLLLMWLRKRDLGLTLVGMANWQLRTFGFVRGLVRSQTAPDAWLESRVLAGNGVLRAGDTASTNLSREPAHGKPS